jgi:hypothetical protein
VVEEQQGLVSVGVKLNLGRGPVMRTLPRDWQTVLEPLPLQDQWSAAEVVGAAAIATAAAVQASGGVMYFVTFMDSV